MTTPILPPGLGPVGAPLPRSVSPGSVDPNAPSFGDLLKQGLNDVSAAQDHSKDMITAFLRGDPVELHQVMAASEEASISLELLVQIRNKLTDAYRTVMNTQT
jgi:flagellar hook-basal body complex protein FliE